MSLKNYHDGDCTIYASLKEAVLEAGICTCGYGFQLMRKGDNSEIYSEELTEKLKLGSNVSESELERIFQENKTLKDQIKTHRCPSESEQKQQRELLDDIGGGLRRAY